MNNYLDAIQPLIKRETTKGNPIKVDPEDEDLLIYNWSESSRGYPANSIKGQYYYLHRAVMERKLQYALNSMEFVDHINGDIRDARRSNLRLATDSNNKANSKDRPRKSEFRGVYRDVRGRQKQYRACISVNGRQMSLGYFHTPEEAAEARDRAAKKIFGEFARLNHE
jgi:hypothetical protein